MVLAPKAIRYLIDAVKHYEEHFDRRLDEPGVSDDELADLANDRRYLAALATDDFWETCPCDGTTTRSGHTFS